ncbi:MAG: superoxide dismutase [Phycisphaeraceae bacterium]
MAFTLPDLPYPKNALEPVIDARTMEIHHGKHHQKYVDELNKAVKGTEWESKSIEEVCRNIKNLPKDIQTPVRNNGGGHFNHSLFWTVLTSPGKGGAPSGDLAKKIDSDLGGLDKFKETFETAGAKRFGSGWAWLCVKSDGKLCVCSTPNQDNPLMDGIAECPGTPILGVDVWEHAYYLNYQNRRPDYLKAFWDVVNWSQVEKNLANV